MNYFVGADLGTSAIKLLLVDEEGNVIKEHNESYPLYSNMFSYSEQNPQDWWDAFEHGIKELLKGIDKNSVKGISFGGQMHGLVILDSKGEVIRPCILWNDGRSVKETIYLNEEIGKEFLVEETGNFAFAGFTLPKLLWVKNNEPKNFNKIEMILLPKDYLTYRLTGMFVTDYSDAAGTLLLDVKNKCWSKKMCELAQINCKKLPKLLESYDVVGQIKEDIAEKLGLPKEIVIATGAGDNAASAIGMGVSKDGECNISLGTSGTIFVSSNKYVCDKEVPLHSFNHANGKYHLMACILSAASANAWWRETILNTGYDSLKDIELDDLANNDVYFLPYLSGERCPHNDVEISGAFVGLRHTTTQKEMSLAVLEGVGFALNNCLELIRNKGVTISEATLCGGGTKSKIWCQIISNILNIKINFMQTEQGPGYGAAILSMVASRLFKNVDDAINLLIKKKESIYPNEEIVESYKQKYNKYLRIYPCLKDFR